ncbi:MAG TPA: hypothetical protein GXX75_03505 [Clostridiales bacterium]|nr:hypothetical protein [Clostridiales bacterium]
MNSNCFVELTNNEMTIVDGGSWLGNTLMLAGALVGICATGPVGVGVGIACAVIGFCDSQGW